MYLYNQLTHGNELVTSVVVADSALAASVIGAVEVVVVAIVVARPRILRVMLLAGAFFSYKIENETCLWSYSELCLHFQLVSGLQQLGPRPVSSEFVYNRSRLGINF